jgi:uncharacterized repeat protein (TIGR01451 family)
MRTRQPFFLSLILVLGLGLALGGLWLLQAGVAAGMPAADAPGVTLTVCRGGGCDHETLQAAIDAAAPETLIKVAAGTYTGTVVRLPPPAYPGVVPGGVVTQVAYISKSLTIRGGYTVTDWDTPDPAAHPTVIDAEGQTAKRGLVVGQGITVTLENLAVTGGNAQGLKGAWIGSGGGGVYAIGALLTVSGCTVSGSEAERGGGLYAAAASTVTLRGNVFADNRATAGGGVYLYDVSNAVVQDCHAYDNLARDEGGGIALYADAGGRATLSGSRLYDNEAQRQSGGGLYAEGLTSVAVSGATLHGNTAGGSGGGLYASDGLTFKLSDSTVYGNVAENGGGVYVDYVEDVAVSGSQVYSNSAELDGGGLTMDSGTAAALEGSDVYSNTATSCGGVELRGFEDVLLNGSSVSGNAASEVGGICLSTDLANVDNCVFADNQAGSHGAVAIEQGTVYMRHNTVARNGELGLYVAEARVLYNSVYMSNTIVADHGVGISVTADNELEAWSVLWHTTPITLSASPLAYVELRDQYSGDPRFVAAEEGNYHLAAGSAALDRGVPVGPDVDKDGVARPQGAAPDLGAYERQPGPEMSIVKRVTPPEAAPGAAITYTLVFSNAGEETATGVRITDVVPAAVSQTGVLSTGAAITEVMPGSAWAVQDLASGHGAAITLSGVLRVPQAAGTLANGASITWDGGARASAAVLTVTNVAPRANAGADQRVPPDTVVTLDGSGSADPNGDPLSYAWAQAGGATVVLSSATAVSPTFTAGSVGPLTFTLTVSDATGLSSTPDMVVVTVQERAVYLPLLRQ